MYLPGILSAVALDALYTTLCSDKKHSLSFLPYLSRKSFKFTHNFQEMLEKITHSSNIKVKYSLPPVT